MVVQNCIADAKIEGEGGVLSFSLALQITCLSLLLLQALLPFRGVTFMERRKKKTFFLSSPRCISKEQEERVFSPSLLFLLLS